MTVGHVWPDVDRASMFAGWIRRGRNKVVVHGRPCHDDVHEWGACPAGLTEDARRVFEDVDGGFTATIRAWLIGGRAGDVDIVGSSPRSNLALCKSSIDKDLLDGNSALGLKTLEGADEGRCSFGFGRDGPTCAAGVIRYDNA